MLLQDIRLDYWLACLYVALRGEASHEVLVLEERLYQKEKTEVEYGLNC